MAPGQPRKHVDTSHVFVTELFAKVVKKGKLVKNTANGEPLTNIIEHTGLKFV
jgi:hypothetical protein